TFRVVPSLERVVFSVDGSRECHGVLLTDLLGFRSREETSFRNQGALCAQLTKTKHSRRKTDCPDCRRCRATAGNVRLPPCSKHLRGAAHDRPGSVGSGRWLEQVSPVWW